MGLLPISTIQINTSLLQSKCKTIPALCYSGAQIRQLSSWKNMQLQLGLAGLCFKPERLKRGGSAQVSVMLNFSVFTSQC